MKIIDSFLSIFQKTIHHLQGGYFIRLAFYSQTHRKASAFKEVKPFLNATQGETFKKKPSTPSFISPHQTR